MKLIDVSGPFVYLFPFIPFFLSFFPFVFLSSLSL